MPAYRINSISVPFGGISWEQYTTEKDRIEYLFFYLESKRILTNGSVWDFAYLTEQVIKNNMSMIFPMCISLIAGYMISREQTDDTLKNILTVPISFKRLLTGKLIVCGVLSIIFGLICSLFTVIAEMIVGFPGFQISLLLHFPMVEIISVLNVKILPEK